MRIALIYPATAVDKKVLSETLPMGLLYLAAVAEQRAGAKVDIYDARHGQAFPDARCIHDYDLIGFSSMSMQIPTALGLARAARRMKFAGPIIFGGPHASVASEHLKNEKTVGAIFIGEAEETFLQYLSYLEGKPNRLQRVWIRKPDGGWEHYPGDGFIEDLDALPFPAREKYGDYSARIRFINLSASRGCPYQCEFCQPSKRILFGARVRRRSTGNILAEIQDAIARYGIKAFAIDDDTFTFHKKAVVEFCEAVKPLGLQWYCQSRSDVDRDTLEAMRSAGCDQITVGIESGSQRMLDVMRKNTTVEQNRRFIQTCNELGIKTRCNMMAGYPGETEEDLKLSLAFIRETQPTLASVSQVTPFPGTELWERMRDDIITLDWDKVARHVHRAKFKSLARRQTLIKYYVTLMNKRPGQPVSADLVRLSPLVDYLCRRVPYLLRILVHWQHANQAALIRTLELARSGRVKEAIAGLRSLSRLYSTREAALGHLGWLYLSTGRPDLAIAPYRNLLQRRPENTEARRLLARALHETGQNDAANQELEECLRLDPCCRKTRDTFEQWRADAPAADSKVVNPPGNSSLDSDKRLAP